MSSPIAQLVEQVAVNHWVRGSSPRWGATPFKSNQLLCPAFSLSLGCMKSQLEQLKQITVVVADTGDIQAIEAYKPQDATTNPSLIYKASQMPEYAPLLTQAVEWADQQGGGQEAYLKNVLDQASVTFGVEILKHIPGRVSTEVDARLSFDAKQTYLRARRLIDLYKERGVEQERILIKIAATWEGIQAAKQLESEGIHCNLTLLFHLAQAVACAESGVFLISPFVGRILDWHKRHDESFQYDPVSDPGVERVKQIHNYYKTCDYPTIIMGASFRSTSQITELAGCDYLTISPTLLEELQNTSEHLPQRLSSDQCDKSLERLSFDEETFRWAINEDAMANDKIAEGIRLFSRDLEKLEQYAQNHSMT